MDRISIILDSCTRRENLYEKTIVFAACSAFAVAFAFFLLAAKEYYPFLINDIRMNTLQNEVAQEENLEKILDQEDHLHFYLTVTFGIETYEAYTRWCNMAKKILKEK